MDIHLVQILLLLDLMDTLDYYYPDTENTPEVVVDNTPDWVVYCLILILTLARMIEEVDVEPFVVVADGYYSNLDNPVQRTFGHPPVGQEKSARTRV